MSDNLISLERFRVVQKQEEDEEDREWKKFVTDGLQGVTDRVNSGETAALLVIELKDEVSAYTTHLMGLSDLDIFTAVGLLERMKLNLLDSAEE